LMVAVNSLFYAAITCAAISISKRVTAKLPSA
jgi:hypothetical protein